MLSCDSDVIKTSLLVIFPNSGTIEDKTILIEFAPLCTVPEHLANAQVCGVCSLSEVIGPSHVSDFR